jgi:LPS-assembly protein
MKRLLLLFFPFFVAGLAGAQAQLEGFGSMPVDITGEHTTFSPGGVAVAEKNVVIRYGEATIYCDYAQYNPDTHDVLLLGNVRIYRDGHLYTGDRAVYNLETKKLTAADFRADIYPEEAAVDTLFSIGPNAYQVRDGIFTTSDSSKPDYHMYARGARIYTKDRIILRDVTFYLGQTPIFWFPAVYQSLNKNQGFTVVPGYTSVFGAYLRSRYTFPITQDIGATAQLDLMSNRGIGLGLDSKWGGGDTKETAEWGRFRSYYVHDSDPGQNTTDLARATISPDRYRISLQDRTYLSEDIYSTINVNKLSDARFLEDFVPGDFRTDPNPDNILGLTKWNEDYTITLTGRKSVNSFFDTTERLPELAFDGKERPIFGNSGLFYTGDFSAGYYRRNFASGSPFADYESFRADTYHEIEFPKELFGWLSVVPKVGLRETYYGSSGQFKAATSTSDMTQSDGSILPAGSVVPQLFGGGPVFRTAFNAELESSFKISKAYEDVQSRAWGLDGLRHVIQPYLDLSYVWTSKNPQQLLQFDRLDPSTQLAPLGFPEFQSIDAIENQAILRLGVNNRFQTRRDNQTINWLEINSYFNINFERPAFEQTFLSLPITSSVLTKPIPLANIVADPGTFSNVFNRMSWTPYNWVRLNVESQLPLLDKGFVEVNSQLNFLLNADTSFQISHEYIQGNPLFADSSYVIFGAYRRLSDNWGVSFREAYEFHTGLLEQQYYAIHRDLSSWIASLALEVINDGGGQTSMGISLTFTLKDMPQISLPLSFDPSSLAGGGTSKSND